MIGLCVGVFLLAFALTFVLTPVARRLALRWGILDHPHTPVKTHKEPVPYLGGVAIFLGVTGSLFVLRYVTHFPSGTLHALRALLAGGFFMLILGLADDLKKPHGLSFQTKFLFQFLGAALLILFDIRIRFIQPLWLANLFTVLWVAGISNAINLIDIMDGLAGSQSFLAAMAFLLVSIPSEAVYVNVAAAAVAGASLAFLPHNFSSRRKIFMGDTGSLTLGFWLSALALGVEYTRWTPVGVLAPLLILGVPIYDTFFVSFIRILQGKSPFLGSKDHMALKLRAMGLSSRQVVALFAVGSVALASCAFLLTQTPSQVSFVVVGAAAAVGVFILVRLYDVHVH